MTQEFHHVHKATNIMTNGIQQYQMEIDRNKQEMVCWPSDIPESISVVIKKKVYRRPQKIMAKYPTSMNYSSGYV
jgi:hypothetical protein